jgi:branched-chain amino acid transport system ATP-binding protein
MADGALQVRGLTRTFGGVTAVDGVDLEVAPGETLGVIGPNGAGKSTFVGLVSGALRPTSGRILLFGQDVSRLGPAARTRLGVGRTHQIPRPFGQMSVLENLLLAARHAHRDRSRSTRAARGRCRDILARTGLEDVAAAPAGGLPLLRRKRLELARALALRPRLLLLDEIGAGLVESETRDLIALIRELRDEVEAIVLIEHVMDVISACCDRTAVLDFGRLIATGETRQVLRDPTVAAVYLGAAVSTKSAESVEVGGSVEVGRAAGSAGATAAGREAVAGPAHAADWARRDGEPLLRLFDVSVHYGGVRALRGVDLEVADGETVALLGANGAGKTTLARAVSGVVRLDSGRIELAGRRIDGRRPEHVARLGVAHCMEGRRIFGRLSVEENLVLAADGVSRSERAGRLAATYEIFPMLREYRRRPGTALSGGQQQMLAIGRALMAAPQLLIFDEISLGLAPVAVARLYEALARIRTSGVAMLLVEQNVERGLDLADRAYVLAHGSVQLRGSPDAIRDAPELRALYMGESGGTRPAAGEDPPGSATETSN